MVGGPSLLTVDALRGRLVAASDEALWTLDIASGAVGTLFNTCAVTASGQCVIDSVPVAVDVARDRAILAGFRGGLLEAIDLESGARTRLTDDVLGGGPRVRVGRMVVDEAREIAYVLDPRNNALSVIDLVTGERALVSR